MSTTNQIVLVTGANQGLGYHTVQQLSKLPGWTILLGSRDASRGREALEKIKADGTVSDVEVVVLDVTSDATIEVARKGIEEKYGKIDVLVNNAALSFDQDKTLSPRERLRATFDVNVFGAAALVEALLPLLEKSSFPRIVNVSSTLGSITKTLSPGNSHVPVPAYNSSKSALNALTAYYSLTFPKSRVVSICPGFNATALNNFTGTQPPEQGAKIIVRAVVEGENSELKTGQFWNDKGVQVPW